MRHKIVIFCLLFFQLNFLLAGKIEKAYEALEMHDYFKAKSIFETTLKKNKVLSSYGLSRVFGTQFTPFYQLDSAYNYIRIAEDAFPKVEAKTKERWLELEVDSMAIQIWKDSIDYKAFLKVLSKESIEDYQYYIDQYVDSEYRNQITELRNKQAFELAKAQNTSAGYKQFLDRYPEAKQRFEANNRFEERLYFEQTITGDLAAFQKFVKNYPNSPFHQRAQDSVYQLSVKDQKVESYYNFIQTNRQNKNVNRAWRALYRLYAADYSPQRIIEFRIDYPDYPFIDELMLDMHLASKRFLPFKRQNLWGFMDENGKELIKPQYEFVEEFYEGLALAGKEGKVGYIDKNNKVVIPFEYDEAFSFDEGIAVVVKDEKYGLIGRLGKELLGFKYDFIGPFNEEMAVIANDTAYGYINMKGELTIPITLEYAGDFFNGHAVVQMNGKKGMIDKSGKVIIPFNYQWLEPLNDQGLCRAKNDSLFGILDHNGSERLPFEYDLIDELTRDFNIVVKENKYGYINNKGAIAIPLRFPFNQSALFNCRFENHHARYVDNGKVGVIDTAGKQVFPAIFEDVGRYSDSNWVAVKKRGKWGYSNQNLRLMISYQYSMANTFDAKYALVQNDSTFHFIDEKEKIVGNEAYDQVKKIPGVGFVVERKGKKGLISSNMKPLLETRYDVIEIYESDLLQISEEHETYYFNIKTDIIIRSE